MTSEMMPNRPSWEAERAKRITREIMDEARINNGDRIYSVIYGALKEASSRPTAPAPGKVARLAELGAELRERISALEDSETMLNGSVAGHMALINWLWAKKHDIATLFTALSALLAEVREVTGPFAKAGRIAKNWDDRLTIYECWTHAYPVFTHRS